MVGRKDQSLASLQKAVSISPQDPEVQFRAALVYNHLGDTTQTLEWLRKALASGVHSNSVRDTADFDHLREDARLQQLLKGH